MTTDMTWDSVAFESLPRVAGLLRIWLTGSSQRTFADRGAPLLFLLHSIHQKLHHQLCGDNRSSCR
jgi:hypothetical protein